MRVAVVLVLALTFTACSIKQEIRPVGLADLTVKEICIRDNPAVRPTFVEAYRSRMESKGFNRNGQVIGRASYDSLGGGGRLDKFINATTKINELVDQLFPG